MENSPFYQRYEVPRRAPGSVSTKVVRVKWFDEHHLETGYLSGRHPLLPFDTGANPQRDKDQCDRANRRQR